MSALTDVARGWTDLSAAEVTWLHALVAEWQLLADLSFADLLLWAPVRADRAEGTPSAYVVLAQMRPTTGPTSLLQDEVGTVGFTGGRWAVVDQAWRQQRIVREGEPLWQGDLPVRLEAVPVRRGDKVIAVLGRDTNLAAARVPSQLELTYLQSAAELATMISEGRFPFPGATPDLESGPRVGDGLIRVDADGLVTYASPNAQSAYRRIGNTVDMHAAALEPLTAALVVGDGVLGDPQVGRPLRTRKPYEVEVEAAGAVLQLRGIPLVPGGHVTGALVLVRDVTEVRRRDRQLLSKDATIREIHHRVKNNLQTVAALLRLQARRLESPEARAALQESVRRVASIALVHETLSLTLDENVAFDQVADRLQGMIAEVAAPETSVRLLREGSFGVLPAQVATPLSMVLTELMQNALEHGFPAGSGAGELMLRVSRADGGLEVVVADDGQGLPEGFRIEGSTRLGLQIVRTLVDSELGGTVTLRSRPGRGTEAVLRIPVRVPQD